MAEKEIPEALSSLFEAVLAYQDTQEGLARVRSVAQSVFGEKWREQIGGILTDCPENIQAQVKTNIDRALTYEKAGSVWAEVSRMLDPRRQIDAAQVKAQLPEMQRWLSIFGKAGCVMGETGSVAFNFQRIGLIEYPAAVAEPDAMFEAALEAGADDVESDEENHRIICTPDDLGAVREALEAKFDTPTICRFDWKPLVEAELTDVETAKKFFDFVETLNDEEDVQRVASNVSVSDEIMNSGNNQTRFICISSNDYIFPGADKISIMLSLPHTPGALYNTLAKFAAIGLNLTKIESRPIEGSDFEAQFYFDF